MKCAYKKMPPQDYISVIRLGATRELESSAPFISEIDQEYISRYKSAKRQRATIAIRDLARKMLHDRTGVPEVFWEFSIEDTQNRIAYSAQGRSYNISFSHSPNFGAVALSKNPIGIDIEEVKEGRAWQDMIDFLDLPANTATITSQRQFLKHWTAHEAKIKFRSASRDAITIHHYHPSPNVILCAASSLEASGTPKMMTFI